MHAIVIFSSVTKLTYFSRLFVAEYSTYTTIIVTHLQFYYTFYGSYITAALDFASALVGFSSKYLYY